MNTPGNRPSFHLRGCRRRVLLVLVSLGASQSSCSSGVDDIRWRHAGGQAAASGSNEAGTDGETGGAGGADGIEGGPPDADATALTAPCPAGYGFIHAPTVFSVREGPGDNSLDFAITTGATADEDSKIELLGAPAWIAAPTSPHASVLTLHTPGGVPYTAFPPPPTFTAKMTLATHPACTSSAVVNLEVANVLHLATASAAALPNDIIAADYQAGSARFVLLDSTHAQIFLVDASGPSPSAGPGIPLPNGDGVVAPSIAASDDDIAIVRGTKLWRLGPSGTRATDSVEIGVAQGTRSLAMAGGYVVIGDSAGPTVVVKEGESVPTTSSLPASIRDVTSDHASFAFVVLTQAGRDGDVYRAEPGPAFPTIACHFTGLVQSPSIAGSTVALQIGLADIDQDITAWDMKTSCPDPVAIRLPRGEFSPQVLGIYDNRVLSIPNMRQDQGNALLDIVLFDLSTKKEVGVRLADQQAVAKRARMIVIGGTRALVVTNTPLLIDL
jgi:hypothetical protein